MKQAKADVAVLTADSLKGRGYLFDGHTKAATYIRDRYKSMGLQPVEGSYVQPFPLAVDLFPETPTLAVDGKPLLLGMEFIPLSSSGSGSGEGVDQVVRVGSGVVLPEHGVNEYAAPADRAAGAVVVLEEVVPDSIRALAANAPERLSVEGRAQIAAAMGARSVVFLTDQLIYGTAVQNAAIPVFLVLREAWPDGAEQVAYSVESRQDAVTQSQNVLGWLPGTAEPDSCVIVAAHYDHHGALGPEFYFPGANDNASGMALLLALADYFSAHPLRYSMLFAAFSGEEIGLIGSRYFVEHEPVDLDQAVLLLNFDMVASGEAGVMAVGGEDFPELFADLSEVNTSLGSVPLSKRRNAPNSDHFFLLQRGIPGFYLYTNRGTQPYHHVNDRPETLEWSDFMHVYELARRFLEQQAGTP